MRQTSVSSPLFGRGRARGCLLRFANTVENKPWAARFPTTRRKSKFSSHKGKTVAEIVLRDCLDNHAGEPLALIAPRRLCIQNFCGRRRTFFRRPWCPVPNTVSGSRRRRG